MIGAVLLDLPGVERVLGKALTQRFVTDYNSQSRDTRPAHRRPCLLWRETAVRRWKAKHKREFTRKFRAHIEEGCYPL
ncbi:MAG TPA: hypothetical protein VGU20_14000 [Stellaceae bacterium]|nr:hypothetical protein [Stellaceae bacterium]